MIKYKSILFLGLAAALMVMPAHSFNPVNFMKKGFKNCTGTCDNLKVCGDGDKIAWCIVKCSKKHPQMIEFMMSKDGCWDTSSAKDIMRTAVRNLKDDMENLSTEDNAAAEEFLKKYNEMIYDRGQ